MGCGGSKDAKTNKVIVKDIEKVKKNIDKELKILLLGSGGN